MSIRNLQALILPRVYDLPQRVQSRMNRVIRRQLSAVLRELDYGDAAVNVYPSFANTANENGVTSFYVDIYAYRQRAAHGLTIRSSFTFNLLTGRSYTLSELFRPGSDYLERISALIKQQIAEQKLPLINEFESIRPDQGYYLEADNLVIYFQIYEYTPYYVGIPEFHIPYSAIEDLLAPNSPIKRLL